MANDLPRSDKNILDSVNCVKLSSILDSFNAPINEEQCWALCYQTIKTVSSVDSEKCPLYLLSGPCTLYIHKEGYVHEKSFTETVGHRRPATSLNKLIASIGATLFLALDYGLESGEERSLDPSLELLIDRLTCTESGDNKDEDKESNDEGIERDSPEYEIGPMLDGPSLVDQVLNICCDRLGSRDQAESHYKAVCRALVAEAMELSSFLHKITSVTAELKNGASPRHNSHHYHHHNNHHSSSGDTTDSSALVSLDGLRLQDWARLWMQVIQELRLGVKLKKVNLTEKPSFEFELTPYEMLLDDIRSQRYKLNKVSINGSTPSKMTKDAHDLILDFIRSRPPLVPASNRKLPPPPPKQPSLFERLLDSIRQQPKLKPTPSDAINQRSSPIKLGRVREDNCDKSTTTTNTTKSLGNNRRSSQEPRYVLQKESQSASMNGPRKKLIKSNLTLKILLSIDDDDDDIIQIQYK